MHRYLGLLLFTFGAAGGWWLGRPPAPAAVEQVSAPQAWKHFKAEAARAHTCEGDIAPHPAWVALALAFAACTLLTVTSSQPIETWQVALGLRNSTSPVAVPF